MNKPDKALLAKLSNLSPAKREALLKKLQQKKTKKAPSLRDLPIAKAERGASSYPLSYAQQRLWFMEQLNPQQATYNIAAALRLNGQLKPELLNQTFKRIIGRHESLRTVFVQDQDGAKQKILAHIDWQLDIKDLSKTALNSLDASILEEANAGFDLECGPLFRATLLKISEDEHVLIVVMHHIISDAWSSQLLLAEVSRFYTALHQGTAIAMPKPSIQYIDYSLWQQKMLDGERAEHQLNYWKDKLAHCNNLDLPSDKPRPNQLSYNGAIIRQTISGSRLQQLKTLCRQQESTLYIALMSLFQSLIYRYSAQDDFCIGTPVAGRNHADLEPLIGFFVNALVIKNNAQGDKSFNQLLGKVKKTVLSAQSHQDIPFEQLVNAISPERDSSHSPLFQVFFSYNPGNASSQLQLPGIEVELMPADTQTAKFDLSLIISDTTVNGKESLSCAFEYNTDLFTKAQIERLSMHFSTLLNESCQKPDAPLHSLVLMQKEEQRELQEIGQNYSTQKPAFTDIAQLIEQQVNETPEKIALVQDSKQLSYEQLNKNANQLAHYLLTQNVNSGDYIGLCFSPSIDLMTALLACLKVGATYVPMDPSYPADRLSYMAENADIKLLLSTQRIDTSAINCANKINIEQLKLNDFSKLNLNRQIDAQQALYIIYTSGSTGKPKAAMVSHANEYNLIQWYANEYGCNSDHKVLVFSAIGFDLTQKNLLTPLCSGAQLHFSAQEWYEPEALLETIHTQNISWINCAPSAFYPIIDNCTDFKQLQSLKNLFLGGEAIQLKNMSPWIHSPHFNASITNMYGPTECTDIACAYTLKNIQTHQGIVPIGKPSANVELHILDAYLNPLPQGCIGELYIGGNGVGLGYLNNLGATAERFISNPLSHSQEHEEKLYKTGDLVRLREDGEIEFIARCDDQIKIRGFRIELGEIENQLRQVHDIEDAVVCTRSISGQTQLLAFLVSSKPLQDQHFYKHSLNQHIPDYMVPIAYFSIDTVPLSANGKIARTQLPKVDLSTLKQAEYTAPRNTDEAELAMIWQNLLGIDNIGIRDNFFELGGHSLLATQMLTRIRDGFEVDLPLRTIFEVSTIEGLAEIICAMKPTDVDTHHENEDDEAFEEGIL